jgi:hypothetical protein
MQTLQGNQQLENPKLGLCVANSNILEQTSLPIMPHRRDKHPLVALHDNPR